jgi:hypothetical protein
MSEAPITGRVARTRHNHRDLCCRSLHSCVLPLEQRGQRAGEVRRFPLGPAIGPIAIPTRAYTPSTGRFWRNTLIGVAFVLLLQDCGSDVTQLLQRVVYSMAFLILVVPSLLIQ